MINLELIVGPTVQFKMSALHWCHFLDMLKKYKTEMIKLLGEEEFFKLSRKLEHTLLVAETDNGWLHIKEIVFEIDKSIVLKFGKKIPDKIVKHSEGAEIFIRNSVKLCNESA